MKDLKYYKNNCEEDYINTPISVLRYITELEKEVESKPLIIDSVSKNEEICNCEIGWWKEDEGGDWYCTIHDKQVTDNVIGSFDKNGDLI